jgi:hypothetical protein
MPRQPLDTPENLAKEGPCQVTFGKLQREVPGMPDQPSAGLEQPMLKARERPVLDGSRRPRTRPGSDKTDVLAEEPNYHGLTRLNADLVQHPAARAPARRVVFDIDSSESPVHGTQEQSAYNGHFESVCYHPLFVFNRRTRSSPEGDEPPSRGCPGHRAALSSRPGSRR